MIKVSIIVPVYNVEKYLDKCMKSLVSQTLKDIEIICINDGSTDSSLAILESYANTDKRIIIIDKENEGQSVARNIGIKTAKGEYLGFVDSDDWVDKDYYEKLYNAAKKCDCDIACAGYRRCKKFAGTIRRKYKKQRVFIKPDDKIKADNIPGDNYVWNKIYRRESWLNHNFWFTPQRRFEDIEILIKILYYMNKMVVVPDTYYHYRRSANSTITRGKTEYKEDFLWAEKQQEEFAQKHDLKLVKPRQILNVEYIKIFNILVLKIYHYQKFKKYKLFGFITFMTMEVR